MRKIALVLLFAALVALSGCQSAGNEYMKVSYDNITEYVFPAKNIKVVCESDGYRVIDVAGELGYQFEITGFDSEVEALEYALNYK